MKAKIGKQDNLRFDGVKFYSVHFDILGSPKENTEIDLDIVPKVMYNTSTQFNIVYDINLSVDEVFTLQLKAVGYFEISEELLENENIKEQMVNTNAPAIVFPYLRSFISMFTSNLGTIPTLTLPTQFFKGKLEEFSE
ncbi:protein-export chaperone SecB [Flavobacterium psychrophilum]|jgi:preprotein translocase subunit SecB|uniref:protein-export chaperone SecB n=1 Tax=Flavobacterium psychrophilum TaxID=96345 RepID=UPI000A3CC6C5|nr:protein-export chaperone SecB [Flavobacterium psychrophilum]EKT3956622.1 protein-export chaperone SecB [Flavobacterium psychrophilum]EKT4498772.1 protein-export chaperone SecB [Flavobacterium psychrophilum]EKT4501183.1 protein-export chaperone SecB [Flavobacterium psychrophilum]EKT4509352.1 protein-export chaperone SecB [Flavobacterium psychrophilum]EKT4549756.1 protein-export chaperone SecB [Flavobacterium psychrophilum]